MMLLLLWACGGAVSGTAAEPTTAEPTAGPAAGQPAARAVSADVPVPRAAQAPALAPEPVATGALPAVGDAPTATAPGGEQEPPVGAPGAAAGSTKDQPPGVYESSISPVPPALRERMTGVTWHEGCPVDLDALALVTLSHWDMEGAPATGRIIVAAQHAEAIDTVFGQLFASGFRLTRVAPAHELGGDDDRIMAADVTSAFNCRKTTGGSSFSQHSYGHAIDVNPLRNPYVKGTRVLPAAGRRYADRDLGEPGMISGDGPVVAAFAGVGWRWGGNWRSLKDYQHFSANGR